MPRPLGSKNKTLSAKDKEALTLETLLIAMKLINEKLPTLSRENQESILQLTKRIRCILEL